MSKTESRAKLTDGQVFEHNGRIRCRECGSNFGHNEGCSQANAAMIREALIAGKSVPVDYEPRHRAGCICADCSGAELTARND